MSSSKYLKKKIAFTALISLAISPAFAQDKVFARKMLDTLTSPYFWGRGYTNDGVHKAADFLADQFKSYGVAPMDGKTYKQGFGYAVNTFPGKMDVSLNGVELAPGKDFIVSPDSRGVKASGKLKQQDSTHYVDDVNKIMVVLENKLTWSAEQKVLDYTVIELNKNLVRSVPATIDVDIENKFVDPFQTANICGLVKGTDKPDSLIVFTAHYDHLGGMGSKTYFPGANDNASGVVQLLGLAKYYAAHPQPFTIAFILFSGEEAGIIGSQYFTQYPEIQLEDIRFLVNLDLEGTGVDGITVVNAPIYPKQFELLKKVNDKGKYFVKIVPRGKAANSDHYFFTEKGVPAFFIYTMGVIQAYHDVFDKSATLPMDHYEDEFHLLTKFADGLMHKPIN